ncbi:hypothetical protein [Nitrososphaeria virus YSH_1032793]|uniref:Uncharacterized protein n=1 Tax=Nitrososphaeria virus YSH_1032793 TaxID=3071320 RepID=A0A976UAF8_9CAUD|nr:hypothetical protein QKV91_gp63 [Yangshan Harbor Nitrososphaeria virus]UVF62267.1 hypothetical protein [Nitrososphaeria virus YSH_1032793]
MRKFKIHIPKYILDVKIVRTGQGIYTPQIKHNTTDDRARKWIEKNGWRLMEELCRMKIKDFNKSQTV